MLIYEPMVFSKVDRNEAKNRDSRKEERGKYFRNTGVSSPPPLTFLFRLQYKFPGILGRQVHSMLMKPRLKGDRVGEP